MSLCVFSLHLQQAISFACSYNPTAAKAHEQSLPVCLEGNILVGVPTIPEIVDEGKSAIAELAAATSTANSARVSSLIPYKNHKASSLNVSAHSASNVMIAYVSM